MPVLLVVSNFEALALPRWTPLHGTWPAPTEAAGRQKRRCTRGRYQSVPRGSQL